MNWKLVFLIATLSVTWTACSADDPPSTPAQVDSTDSSVDSSTDAADDTSGPLDGSLTTDVDSLELPDTGDATPLSDSSDAIQVDTLPPDTQSADVPAELPSPADVVEAEVEEEVATGPQPITVLFIGNSYTFGNQLPDLVESWAQAIGVDLSTEMIAKGGALLEQHAADADTLATIAEMAPTYVVLQGQSYVPLVAPFTFYTGVAPLAQAAHAAGSTPVLFETWARQAGHSMYSNELAGHDPTSMQAALRDAYMKAAADNDGIYAPVGDAWEVSLEANPELTLHSGDGSHAAMTGSYLAAAVFVGLLGEVDVTLEANTWTSDKIEEADGASLRAAAQQVLSAP